MKKQQKVYGVAGASAIVLISILVSSSLFVPSATISQTTFAAAPETVDVTPQLEFLTPQVTNLDVQITTVTPDNFADLASAPELPQFLAPIWIEAAAIPANQNSITEVDWTIPGQGTGVRHFAFFNNSAATPGETLVYYANANTNKVGRLILSGPNANQVTEWLVPTGASSPTGLVYDAATSTVWFTEATANKVGKLDPASNAITEYFLPAHGGVSSVFRIAVEGSFVYYSNTPGGNQNNQIGRINTAANTVSEWTLCTNTSIPCAHTISVSNGDVYFSNANSNYIGRLRTVNTPLNQLTTWAIPQPSSGPGAVIFDSATGTVYFGQDGGNRVAKLITGSNQITQWQAPIANRNPFWITVDSAGTIYYTDYNENKVGRLVPSSNLFTEWSVTSGSTPIMPIRDPQTQNIYYADQNTGKIARLS